MSKWLTDKWRAFQDMVDISGSFAVTMWTLSMLAISLYATVKHQDVSAAITSAYVAVISAYTINRTWGGKP